MLNLLESLKEQKKLELSHIEKLKPTAKAIPSVLLSAMIQSIIHDSQKHADICQALIDVEAGAVAPMLDTDIASGVKMSQAIKQHIRVEADMISRIESMIEQVEENRVESILEYLLSDERRHHMILTRLSNLLDRDDVTYDEYLELAQKYMFVLPPEE